MVFYFCSHISDFLQEIGGVLAVDRLHSVGQEHMGDGSHICSHHGCDC